jgi:hypothetical protein
MRKPKAQKVPNPYAFPKLAHKRRHGPTGHKLYRGYKPWLRDEFGFRCVYCLTRETWADDGHNRFSADHVKAKSKHVALTNDYDNLVYCCQRCNTLKSTKIGLPDPCEASLKTHLKLLRTGRFIGITPEGKRLVEYLLLNANERVRQRTYLMRLFAKQAKADPWELENRFGFPEDLPNLRKLRPPKGNKRPEGLEDSYYALKKSGKLPLYF